MILPNYSDFLVRLPKSKAAFAWLVFGALLR
jgi:hypothetical protein